MLIDLPRVEYKNTRDGKSDNSNSGTDLEAVRLNELALKEYEEMQKSKAFKQVKLSDIK